MTGARLLSIRNLTVDYLTHWVTVRAVDGVSLSVSENETLGVAGESGSGKTTLALSILKLLPPQARVRSGEILFKGRNLLELSEEEIRRVRWREIALVFQNSMNALNPVKRIAEQVAEPLVIHQGLDKREALRRAVELLSFVGIDRERAFDYPHEFSGGMRQRALIAMALTCRPQLLVADEPTTALDVVTQAQIIGLLKKLRKEYGFSIIVISHDISVLAELCDRIAVMQRGKVVEEGTSEEICLNPRHPYTKQLLESVPRIKTG